MAKSKRQISSTEDLIIDLDKLLKNRHAQREAEDVTGEIATLEETREKQKAWNYQRGALLRKYQQLLEEPKKNAVQIKILEKDLKSRPKFKLELIDNRIKQLKKQDYLITFRWKGSESYVQEYSDEVLNMPSAAVWVLEKIKEQKESEDWGSNNDQKWKVLQAIQYNIDSIISGGYKEATSPYEYPIFIRFVGDYIIIDV